MQHCLSLFFVSDLHPNIIIDDGYHEQSGMLQTFRSVRPVLQAPFMYFVEDVRPTEIDSGRYLATWWAVLKECDKCSFRHYCEAKYTLAGCIFVIIGRA